jgi:hypothetical protein
MQRITIRADVRRRNDLSLAAEYLAGFVTDTGATIDGQSATPLKRGGCVQITVDTDDARATMKALRVRLDSDTNAYATDTFNELRIGAFASASGGFLGFCNEDYRFARELLS